MLCKGNSKTMKKITLISSAILAILVVSCQKEKENVPPNQDAHNLALTNLENRIFKFNKEVKVYDKGNTNFVTVVLKSDNDSAINNAFESYNNSEMVLIYDKPLFSENKNLLINNDLKEPKSSDVNNKDILIIKLNHTKNGNSTGYKIIPKENSRQYTVNLYVSGSPAYYYATCNGFYVGPITGSLIKQYNSYYDGTWHLQETHGNLSPGQGWTTSPQSPYAYRLLQLNPVFMGNCYVGVTVYD